MASIGGTAFHNWTEEWDLVTNLGTGFMVPSFETFLRAALEDACETHYRKTGEELNIDDIKCSRGEPFEWWLNKGPEMCSNYENWRKESGWILEEVELSYEQELGLSVPAVGFIDREFFRPGENPARILVDIKTSKKEPKTTQLFEYAVIRRLQGVKIDYVAYYNARKGCLSELQNPNTWTVSWLKNAYGNVIHKIQNGIFVPNPGVQCKWCPVREVCDYADGN